MPAASDKTVERVQDALSLFESFNGFREALNPQTMLAAEAAELSVDAMHDFLNRSYRSIVKQAFIRLKELEREVYYSNGNQQSQG